MSNIEDGGPAFPSHGSMGEVTSDGMSLRDYFASKALQGICASNPTIDWTSPRLASEAYELADAMLKARIQS